MTVIMPVTYAKYDGPVHVSFKAVFLLVELYAIRRCLTIH